MFRTSKIRYASALLAAVAVVRASPVPQGVTAAISPSASAPSGCIASYLGSFGIAVMNITTAPATVTMAPVSQISDGQAQAPRSTAPAVSQISDGQVQATSAAPLPQITDSQPATPASPSAAASASSSNVPSGTELVACQTNSTLSLTLAGGVLKDAAGRTGYIASNYQFQFDGPPQAGAIYTSGFSVCSNGSLALGGSDVFYQCLSGSFYNLYDRDWAAQCSPVTIETLILQDCSS